MNKYVYISPDFRQALVTYRKANKLTYNKLGEILDIPAPTLCRIEKGYSNQAYSATINKIAELIGVNPSYSATDKVIEDLMKENKALKEENQKLRELLMKAWVS